MTARPTIYTDDVLPDLTADEALLLTNLLTRLADAIWRTYGPEMGLLLADKHGERPKVDPQIDLPFDGCDDDLPF